MEILKFTTVTQEWLIGLHSVRVPSKTALARATCLLGTLSSGISNPGGVVVVPEFKRPPIMPHTRQGSHYLLLKTV